MAIDGQLLHCFDIASSSARVVVQITTSVSEFNRDSFGADLVRQYSRVAASISVRYHLYLPLINRELALSLTIDSERLRRSYAAAAR
ncbi:hypothetical protein WMF31_09395 [Sorangium sp. So ce1036]|uniref:hypothetical protein n=1 Tax=Sorangium sp. So ce1036 TaxID=3133328 RepID=UPI003F0E1952